MLSMARVLLLGTALYVLSGCGGEDAPAPATTSSNPSPPANTATPNNQNPNPGAAGMSDMSGATGRPGMPGMPDMSGATGRPGMPGGPGATPPQNIPDGSPPPGFFADGSVPAGGGAQQQGRRRGEGLYLADTERQEPEINFPESFADWTEDDFTKALKVRTPRLGSALMARAKSPSLGEENSSGKGGSLRRLFGAVTKMARSKSSSSGNVEFVDLAKKLLAAAEPRGDVQTPVNQFGRQVMNGGTGRSRFGAGSVNSRGRSSRSDFDYGDYDSDYEEEEDDELDSVGRSASEPNRPTSGRFSSNGNTPPFAGAPTGRFSSGANPPPFAGGPTPAQVQASGNPSRSTSGAGRFAPGRFQSGGQAGTRRSAAGRSAAQEPPLSDRNVVQVILRSLLVHNSAEAWSVLHSVLQGQQKTPLDLKQASIVVFEEVFGSETLNTERAEDFVVSVVNLDDQALPAMELLVSLASRVSRANMHLDDRTSDTHAGRPEAKTGPRNSNSGIPPGFLAGGRFGNPQEPRNSRRDEPQPSRLTPLSLPPGSVEAVVPVIRSRALFTAVQSRIENVSSLRSGKFVLTLASMLPGAELRRATFQVLDQHHEAGAKAFLDAGLYTGIARDPAHLLVLKSLPRLLGNQSGRRNSTPPDPARTSWSNATYKMVLALRKQLRETSSKTEIEWEGALFPKLHRGATAEHATRFVIEEEGKDGVEGAPGATEVYYTRCKVTPRSRREMKEISKHYERVTRGKRREFQDAGILWIDGIRTTKEGKRATLDVIIQSGTTGEAASGFGAAAGRADNRGSTGRPGHTFTLETIAVVSADPKESMKLDELEQSNSAAR